LTVLEYKVMDKKSSGYEIGGVHEEEYLTTPDAKVPKTIIRYAVKKK